MLKHLNISTNKYRYFSVILSFAFIFILVEVFSLYKYEIYNMMNLNSLIQVQNDQKYYEEAFVTYTFKNYEPLTEILVKSAHSFSTRSIIVYAVDFNSTIDINLYPKMILRHIKSSDCGNKIKYTCKPYVILHSNITYGIYLDTDNVLNKEVDMMFDVIKKWNRSHPLSILLFLFIKKNHLYFINIELKVLFI
jgi:hypothetical protein